MNSLSVLEWTGEKPAGCEGCLSVEKNRAGVGEGGAHLGC